MKAILKTVKVILQVILILIIIVNLISIVMVKILDKSYPNIFGYTYFSVVSASMEPTINIGDEIIVKLTNDVKENDVITFREGSGNVTHRLIRIEGNDYITKGDGNEDEDNPISKDVIIGKVILVVPWLGKLKYVLTNYFFIIVVIIVYVIYGVIINKQEKNKF